jgi:hypothetical protein
MKRNSIALALIVSASLLLASGHLVSPQAEVPTWSIGDSWAWGVTDLDVSQLFTEALKDMMELTVPDISVTGTVTVSSSDVFTVVGETATQYRVSWDSSVNVPADISFSGTMMGEPFSGSVIMNVNATGDGTMYFQKDDLSVTSVSGTLDMDMTGTVETLGMTMDMAMDLTMTYTISYDPPLDLFDFPISVGESWTIDTTATIDGNITGTITAPMAGTQTTSEPISDSVTLSISASCTGTKSVTLPDGTTTSAYVISLSYDWGELVGDLPSIPFAPGAEIYYSPDRGYIVGQKISLADVMGTVEAAGGEGMTGLAGLGAADTFEVLPITAPTAEEVTPTEEVTPPEEMDILPIIIAIVVIVVVLVAVAIAIVITRR